MRELAGYTHSLEDLNNDRKAEVEAAVAEFDALDTDGDHFLTSSDDYQVSLSDGFFTEADGKVSLREWLATSGDEARYEMVKVWISDEYEPLSSNKHTTFACSEATVDPDGYYLLSDLFYSGGYRYSKWRVDDLTKEFVEYWKKVEGSSDIYITEDSLFTYFGEEKPYWRWYGEDWVRNRAKEDFKEMKTFVPYLQQEGEDRVSLLEAMVYFICNYSD